MWFKNILLYEILEPFPCDTEQLGERLAKRAIRPTHKTEKETIGWVSPFGDDSAVFSHSIAGCHLLKACREVRLLPSTVVQENLIKQIKGIENTESRRVFKREKSRIKDDIIFDLLPKAFTRRIYTYLYIDTVNKKIIVDSSSRATAEGLLQLLRDTIGGLKLGMAEFNKTPTRLMTEWLTSFKFPSFINIEDTCELMELNNGDGIIRCKRQDLAANEIQNHLKSGKQVVKLGLTWRSRLCFTLEQDFSVKRIQCLDTINEARKDTEAETDAERLDADFTLMLGEFRELINDLYELLGVASGSGSQHTKEYDSEVQMLEEA